MLFLLFFFFHPPFAQAGRRAAPTHSRTSGPADSLSRGPESAHTLREKQSKQGYTRTDAKKKKERKRTEPVLDVCVCRCVCFIPPGNLSSNQQQWVQIKAVRWKKCIWPQQEDRNVFALASGLRASPLQIYTSSWYSPQTSGCVGLLISKYTSMHRASTSTILAASWEFWSYFFILPWHTCFHVSLVLHRCVRQMYFLVALFIFRSFEVN